ncbi:MAG: M48 family metalloprotease [Planctomycetota bacterium]
MTAVFPTIIALLTGLSFEEFYAETAMPEEAIGRLLLALPICLAPIIAAEILFLISRRTFARGRPYDIRPFARYVAALPLPLYALIIFAFGWPKIVVPLGLEGSVLLDHVAVLMPYFLLLAGALVQSARLRRPMRLSSKGPVPAGVRAVLPAVAESARHLGLLLVPLFGLILLLDLARDTSLRIYFNHLPLLASGFLAIALLGLALAYPAMFRVGMGLRPLVAGAPLRRRLEELAGHLGFRCRDILYWPTRRPVLNAAIVGILPGYRYVILTDELCKRLTLEELGAVFTHEVGHGKKHHALLYLFCSVAFLTALVPLGDLVGGWILEWTAGRIDAGVAAAVCVYLPAFAFYWVVLFGYLSRRFELEADIFGVEMTQDPSLFITTLEKVARVGRIERRRRPPRHFSIAGRTDFLRRAFIEREPDLLPRFRRQIGIIRRVILWSSSVVLFLAIGWLALESLRGVGVIFLERGQDSQARAVLEASTRVRASDAVARTLLAEVDLYGDIPANGSATSNWELLQASEQEFGPLLRQAVLGTLRVGWARAVARGKSDVSLELVRRARLLNRQSEPEEETRERPVFDPDFEQNLLEMASVSASFAKGDAARLEEFTSRPPRWLRRTDVSAALEFLRNLEGERNDL